VIELEQTARLTKASKVLEIGCGTGNHIARLVDSRGCCAWGIDPSEAMLRHAPAGDRLQVSRGSADRLPFPDEFFDFAFSVDVIHHVPDTMAYFSESCRVLVPGGRLCTLTDSENIIRQRKPLAEFWPETVQADLARYPQISVLRRQMMEAGFVDIEEKVISWPVEINDPGPFQARAFSCLHLISDEAFERGLQLLIQALRAGPVQGLSAYSCLWARSRSSRQSHKLYHYQPDGLA
jgi:SAM-dependent methyltransferase